MFVSIRRYRGVQGVAALCREIELQFAPRLRAQPGFVAYYALEEGDGRLTTVSVFSSARLAEESNDEAASWMAARDPAAPLAPFEIASGTLRVAVPPVRG